MGIILKWAELSKGYYYGEFLQHKPGLGCEITGDTTDDEALDMLEKLLDKWHTKKTIGTPFEALKPETTTHSSTGTIPIISKDTEKLEIAIDNATTFEQLNKIKDANPVLPYPILLQLNTKMEILRVEANNKSMGKKNSK